MREQLQELLEKRTEQCVSHKNRSSTRSCPKIEQKKEGLLKRSGEIIKAKATGKILSFDKSQDDEKSSVQYNVHFKYLIKHKGMFIMEEEIEERRAEFYKGILVEDQERNRYYELTESPTEKVEIQELDERIVYEYDRLRAVQYAERWWNTYNPAYETFEVDCTNYISQCLHSGGGPMRGYPNRGAGWWMLNRNWSYSWSVANSLRNHLPNANKGLRAKAVSSPQELHLGDVICYDFQGDGRFDHTTIVTAKDADGMPLVNAHTTNSRMRYWAYEDSTAYTPNIKYKFLTVVDDQ
ncbi:amidase domain-containing protein [Cytobacillus depressus]|uniref:Amidase domain-containing protein n=1 Tax=Cytobacillus depressus TaxID=1602942 RepID=A0A6L3VDY4_9BACI|nr:amidase domain-containing protein [Cytobacillus depressus]KAB2337700.1 amidase domain-containing protein [Cytobacillus depressus]